MGSFTWKDSFGGLDWVGGGPRTTQPYRKNCYYSVSSVSLWPTAASSCLPCKWLALRNFSLICLSLLLFRGTCPRVPFSSLGTQAVRSYCIVNWICDLIINRSPMLHLLRVTAHATLKPFLSSGGEEWEWGEGSEDASSHIYYRMRTLNFLDPERNLFLIFSWTRLRHSLFFFILL